MWKTSQRAQDEPRFESNPSGLAVGSSFLAIRSGSSADVTLSGATLTKTIVLIRDWPTP
jgi:hypothetical protein